MGSFRPGGQGRRTPGQGTSVTWEIDVDCNEVLEQLADYLDRDARAELCSAIEEHLKHCHDCQVEVDTVKKTIVLYQADRHLTTPVSISTRLQNVLAKAYESGPEKTPID